MKTRQPAVSLSRLYPALRAGGGLLLSAVVLSACSSAPVRFYTLGAPAVAVGAESTATMPITDSTPVIEVERARMPDYLDSQDIMVRNGHEIERSGLGRWASRLSVGATDLITARLAQKWPHLFVTDQSQPDRPTWRLQLNISRLDVSRDGQAALNADWAIIPQDSRASILRNRTTIVTQGNTGSNANIAKVTENLLNELSDRIEASWPSTTGTATPQTAMTFHRHTSN
ncbi:membrane integrity-associated transporter subunit PqiC [Komagataeibacter diospyri]|uniref:Outer membrane lipoprotein n=1 Tax=Komagataeibacter diospyri TaxID=1932662 RepID=A0A4P5NVR6_9PROT|nr:PqiC family protein [Komagataeibacter diospyri]GCE83685.1 outer membrane lipoprotein [Komagataeibacter diospyri]GCE90585.1 outer membrane lipoprotein [Komagataeibacter diospyri]